MKTESRYDMYAFIHKGLRAAMSRGLCALGSLDAQDDAEITTAFDDVMALLRVCRAHLKHENSFVHTAMEQRRPGSSRAIAGQHVEHETEIAALEQEAERILRLPSLRRCASVNQFYRRFALFVADNLEHMAQEETDNNAVLWSCYSDDELRAIEQALVASIAPDLMPQTLLYMVPAINPHERTQLLGGMQAAMPAEAFAGILSLVEPALSASHRRKLAVALDQPREKPAASL